MDWARNRHAWAELHARIAITDSRRRQESVMGPVCVIASSLLPKMPSIFCQFHPMLTKASARPTFHNAPVSRDPLRDVKQLPTGQLKCGRIRQQMHTYFFGNNNAEAAHVASTPVIGCLRRRNGYEHETCRSRGKKYQSVKAS